MTNEMISAAFNLQKAAIEYKSLYESEHGSTPVVWLKNNETGEGIFISDSFNTELIKQRLNN